MHAIVVGCGRVGAMSALELERGGHDVVVIDRRASAFRRLGPEFTGRKVEGVGFDRGLLAECGITAASAVLAVTSGDNSNILIARVAREMFGVQRVVARIYDPKRAVVYERLGIPTVATVTWTSARALRAVLPTVGEPEWTDPTASHVLIERRVPASVAGKSIGHLDEAGYRVCLLSRGGRAEVPRSSALLQEDDVIHVMTDEHRSGGLDELLGVATGGVR